MRIVQSAREMVVGKNQVQVSHSNVDNPKSLLLQLQGRFHNDTTFSFGEILSCSQKLSSTQQDYHLCLENLPANFHQQL